MYTYTDQQSYFTGYNSPNQYQNYSTSPNSTVPSDSLDWPFLDNIDPALCSTKEYKHILKEISRIFVRATIIDLGSPPRMIKLFRILQIVITKLSSKCNKCYDEIEDLRQKYRILQQKYENAKHRPAKVENVNADRCPICQNPFRTLQHLDLHVFSKHPEVSTLWQAIRTPQPPGAFAFPWQKAQSITSTVYPQSTQNFNEQPVQNLLEDFRKKLADDQKESKKQMQEWIGKKMSKVESKIEDLQQTAKNEIIESKMNVGEKIQKKEKTRHKKKQTEPKRRKHHQKGEFNTEKPFYPPENQKSQKPSSQPQMQQPQTQPSQPPFQPSQPPIQPSQPPFQPSQPPIQSQNNLPQQQQIQPQPQPPQSSPDNDDVHNFSEPSNGFDNGDNGDNNENKPSLPSENSEAGSIVSLEATSNINFQSPPLKLEATGSDAEYESAPPYEDFNGSGQNSIHSHVSGNSNNGQNEDFNLSQNSEINGHQPTPNVTHHTGKKHTPTTTTNGHANQNFDHKIEPDDYDFNGEDSNLTNTNIHIQQLPDSLSNSQGGGGSGSVFSHPSIHGETVDDSNFVTSYVQPPKNSFVIETEDEEPFNDRKSDGGDVYTKQLDTLNTSDLYKATPPQGRSRLRHSSSAGDKSNSSNVQPPKPLSQNNTKMDQKENDYEYSYSEDRKFPTGFNNDEFEEGEIYLNDDQNALKNMGHFDNNDDLINKNYDDYNDEFDQYDEDAMVNGYGGEFEDVDGLNEKVGGNGFSNTRDDGTINSSFNIDSPPQQDLPEFSDSQSARNDRFRNKNMMNSPSKSSSKKFRKETYQKEDLNQMYNDIIQSDEY